MPSHKWYKGHKGHGYVIYRSMNEYSVTPLYLWDGLRRFGESKVCLFLIQNSLWFRSSLTIRCWLFGWVAKKLQLSWGWFREMSVQSQRCSERIFSSCMYLFIGLLVFLEKRHYLSPSTKGWSLSAVPSKRVLHAADCGFCLLGPWHGELVY